MTRRGKTFARVCRVFGATLMMLIAALLVVDRADPVLSERIWGPVHLAIDDLADRDTAPTITLAGPGGSAELHRCARRTFVEMAGYRAPGIPATYAAHNMCGGDVILRWKVGQPVRIAGRSDTYQVVDAKVVSKSEATVSDLSGVAGELLLQSCFYGENRMRIVGLAVR